MERINWVRGNTLNLAVPLRTKTASGGQWVTEDYVPPEGSELHVNVVGGGRAREYEYTIDGNVVMFTDDGRLGVGCYGIEITVRESDNRHLRYFRKEIEIYECSCELGCMPPDGQVMLDAAIFVQGQKGDKGDPFTYDDFTPEQIADLKKPATDAAAEVSALEAQIEEAERGRVSAEEGRVSAEEGRVSAEADRVLAEQQRASAESGRVLAEQSRVSAEESRELAEGQRQQTFETDEAKRQSDYEAAELQRNSDYQTAEQQRDDSYRSAEQQRNSDYQEAEQQRDGSYQSAEQQRNSDYQAAEQQRDQGESGRVLAEQGRVSAEEGRVSAEAGRVSAEEARVGAETQREETFATYGPLIDDKLDKITEEKFNEIFN